MAFEILAAVCAASVACAAAFALGRRSARRDVAAVSPSVTGEDGHLVGAAHEMRTPLTGVIGAVDLLLDTGLAPDQRTYAKAIHSSASAMLRLVDELLRSTDRSSGASAGRAETIEIAGLVEEIAELLAPRAQAKGLDFAAIVAADAPAEIIGDPGRLRQILLNLAGNAVKFTTEGGVGLRVERGESGLDFKVVDTGPGFDPKRAERLFLEFERAPGAGGDGAGLGLAISRKLARAMGGDLNGRAEPGLGATFTLTLPCWGATAAAVESPLAARRFAVVSDSAFTGPWLVEWLGAQGAAARLVTPADLRRDPAGALAAFGPHVVAIDRGGADTAELAELARRCGAGEVLTMLAPAERKALETLKADGFDGYLVKPLRAASLLTRLSDAAPLAGPAASEGVAFPRSGGLKVLVAEDDPVSALIALAHLSRLGHASVHVADGAAAVATFEAETFDVVLLDIRMPKVDGRAAAGRMRVVEAAAGRSPAIIVALTADEPEEGAATGSPEIDHRLAKPLDRRALEAVLAPLAARAVEIA